MEDVAANNPPAVDETELVAMLQDEERLAASYRSTQLAEEQRIAIDYYEAAPFGDEEEGRSQVVSPDVAEVVDYMTISVLRTMVAGDRVVEFEAKEYADEDAADEATEAVNYIFMRGQDGYKVLSDWLQSGLIEKIGVVKTTAQREVKRHRERFADLSDDMLAGLMDEPGLNVVAVTQDEQGLYIADVETHKPFTRYVDLPIPSEEFLFSSRMRDVDDIGYKCHKTLKTKSELIEMGFDRDMVEELPLSFAQISYDIRHTTRWEDEGLIPQTALPGMEKVWLREEYVNVDLNGDGIAELVQVFRVEEKILAMQEVEDNPFVVFTPFPRAHRMVGNSLADKVMDIQRIRSVILRQTLDGIYLTNNPRLWVPDECQTENTIDDLLTVRPGGIVRGRGAGGRPEPLAEPFDVQRGMGMLQFLAGERESRTGITRLNQGLDADALNKTATGTALMQASGQQFEEFVARNFAEALSRLFLKKLRLMIAAGDPIAVKVEGGFKTVDPKNWTDDMDVSVRVGLGSGRKDQRLAYRSQLLQFQQLALQAGLIQPEHLYRNMAGWIRDASLGNPADFWQDPMAPDYQPPQQQPDPKTIEAQSKAQTAQIKAQAEMTKAQVGAQSVLQKAQIDNASLQQKAVADHTDAILKAQTAAANLAFQQQKFSQEMDQRSYESDLQHLQAMTKIGASNG